MSYSRCCLMLAVSLVLLSAGRVQASLELTLGGLDITNTPPSATVPNDAIKLLFEDTATANTVKLSIDVTGTSKKVTQILFNVDPLITGLSFLNVSGPTASKSFAANSKGIAGPLSGFDIEFGFGSSGPNGALWNGSALAVFLITKTAGTATLTEDSFNFMAANSYFGAAHINLPNGSSPSGKYGSTSPVAAVPEVASFVAWSMLCLGGAGSVFRRHRSA